MKRMKQIKFLNSQPTALAGIALLVFCSLGRTWAMQDSAAAQVSGVLKRWHKVTLSFQGPKESETGRKAELYWLSPFRDYRLRVTFTHVASGNSYQVPGYFAADGRAAESRATSGSVWRVHFMPDAPGEWRWTASFRQGRNVAVADDDLESQAAAFDGASGSFQIDGSDKSGRDFRAQGRLDYVEQRYLRFAGSGQYFLKGGADSPENLLAYADFDDTWSRKKGKAHSEHGEALSTGLHRYEPHIRDWQDGDPSWRGGKGKSLIGALNYLAGKGMNSVYFLTMNVSGDGDDVWPWTKPNEPFFYDCSKLDQWEIVFEHMTRLGLMLHVISQETENDALLDSGELGVQRKLYYRELIARFAHHPALVWNLGEENVNSERQRKAFASWIRQHDPYRHPVVIHTSPNDKQNVYPGLLGFRDLEGPSLQISPQTRVHADTIKWIERSAQAGRPWFVCLDEIGPADTGVKPDADDPEHFEVRWQSLWGNLMAGGAGVEWYFGYKYSHNDLNAEDWRSRDKMWDQTHYALEFFQRHLPFTQMSHADDLTITPDDYCFAKRGEVYAIYLPKGGSAELNLESQVKTYKVSWFNPRVGGELKNGSVIHVKGPGKVSLGEAPTDPGKDWVVLIK
ncbi:MAG: DUF5060 domain-containing protein [Acidobacteria bacterium]|nr:DUF5060 domain-containing protein [Acidobacteriota bacterium]